MFEVKGFVFHHSNGEIHKYPLNKIMTTGYEEISETMKDMKIKHYMFILKEVKE